MWEPENIMVVGSFWHNHYDDDYWEEGPPTYCELYKCEECPRYGDDCDGKEENMDDKIAYYEKEGDEYVYYDENGCELYREDA